MKFGGTTIAQHEHVPQTLHQGVVWVFRDDPALAFDLARSVFGIELPELREIHDRRSELDRFAPCVGDTGELRPDLAFSARVSGARKSRRARCGVGLILEVQRRIIQLKRWRIWVYWALFSEHLKLSTIVMVVALNDAVSRWARLLGRLEFPPRDCLLVLDRQNMPRISSLDQARQRPSMAVLSALIHQGDLEVLHVGFTVALELPDDRRWRYATALFSVAPESERDNLRGVLNEMEERYQLTRAERNSIAYHDGKRDGQRAGKRSGKREGMREGMRAGLVKLVLTILELRDIPVNRASKARIRACKNIDQLERWAARAKRVDSIDELLA